MLVTTCAHCKARFRVTPQQLNEKQGQVRCGRCRKVFNGFESLERFPDDDTGARLLAAREADERRDREALEDIESLAEDELPEIENVGAAPPLPSELGGAAPPATPPTTPPMTPLTPAPVAAPVSAPPAEPARPRAARSDAARSGPHLTLEAPPRKPLSRAWSFGVVLVALVLAVELAFAFRGPIAQRYPPLRAPLEAACGYAHCTVPWSRQDALLKLEESEMLEVPGKPGEIALGARIRNLATVAQEYPHVELTLTDYTGQPAARRVLRPTDYLGRPVAPGDVLAPGAEIAIQMRLETPRLKATGYELLLFYP